MKILVINAGSSSLKCQYFIHQKSVASARVERIGEESSHSEVAYQNKTFTQTFTICDHQEALEILLKLLKESHAISSINDIDAIGHRVVHGGAIFTEPTPITVHVIAQIRALIPLAPLHNPANLKGIEIIAQNYPTIPQVAVFDTAFHQSIPLYASLYPIPYRLYEDSKIQRYGFHGTSHAYVAKEASLLMGQALRSINLISLHLGNGASITAIQRGKSIDTSMGFTPLEGLMMGTRCGDIDPAILPFLSRHHGMSIDKIDTMLNKESGLKGICGSNDMREILTKVAQKDPRSTLALEMYIHKIKKYIGAYTVLLGRVDAIIFTGGIGEHAPQVREMICTNMQDSIGLKLNPTHNQSTHKPQAIHSKESKIKAFVISTNEELEIAVQTQESLHSP